MSWQNEADPESVIVATVRGFGETNPTQERSARAAVYAQAPKPPYPSGKSAQQCSGGKCPASLELVRGSRRFTAQSAETALLTNPATLI